MAIIEGAVILGDALLIIKKTVVSSAVLTVAHGALDLTGLVSGSGEVYVEDIILQTNATGFAAGTNIEIRATNVKGTLLRYAEAVASLGANITKHMLASGVTAGLPFVLEVGAKLTINSTVADCTGAGTCDIYLICRRVAADTLLAAA